VDWSWGAGKDGRWFSWGEGRDRESELLHADRTIRSSRSRLEREREREKGKKRNGDALKTELAE